jgi:hypothetical protein
MYAKTIKRKEYPKTKERETAYADLELPAPGRS